VKIAFSSRSWDEYLLWQGDDRQGLDRVNALLKECMRDPFRGTGKPEPLGGNLAGWWSRRINQEHRLVYRVRGKGEDQVLDIAQCRYHY
jgi:toxin YoeB